MADVAAAVDVNASPSVVIDVNHLIRRREAKLDYLCFSSHFVLAQPAAVHRSDFRMREQNALQSSCVYMCIVYPFSIICVVCV